MIKILDIIEAMEQRDAEALERMLVEHVEHFVDRLREETMKRFWVLHMLQILLPWRWDLLYKAGSFCFAVANL